jgi:DNA end-binding protein Ku
MARTVWSGTLNFGLVTVPVGLYPATEDHTVRFHQLQRGTSDRIRYQRINERTGREVDGKDIVKGYELAPGEYVVIEPEELDEIAPGRSKTIDISGFVDLDEVEPIYFDRTYYLGPRGEEYARVYALLRDALRESNRAGIANFTMRGKAYLAAVRAERDILVLHTMHYSDEVRDPARQFDSLPAHTPLKPQELAAARQLIDALGVEWHPEEYRDTFDERVRELVEAKRKGNKIVVGQGGPPAATNVIDLMDALQRSIEQNLERPARPRRAKAGDDHQDEEREPRGASTTAVAAAQAEDLSKLSKAELYTRATEAGISGRSTMNRAQLEHAVAAATRPRRRLHAS